MVRPVLVVLLFCLILVTHAFSASVLSGDSPNLFPSQMELFDLGYDLDDKAIFYPGQRFDYELFKDVEGFNSSMPPAKPFRYWFAMYSFCQGEHGGTHVDAPIHFNENGWRLGEIPIERLVDVQAVVVDVERHVFSLDNPRDFVLEVEHLHEHERDQGPIPFGVVVLVHFGWGRYWPDKENYLGIEKDGTLNFPGISGKAAKFLVEQRKIIGVGVDSASGDPGDLGGAGVSLSHLIFCGNQVYIIENVANLGNLLQKIRPDGKSQHASDCDLRLIVLPIKSKGTGGPARVIGYCKSKFY